MIILRNITKKIENILKYILLKYIMKSIQCKRENGEIFGLLVEPNKGEYLSEEHLQILLKNIKNIFSKQKQSVL